MNTLTKLDTPTSCGCESQDRDDLFLCRQPAHWLVNGVPVCDEDITVMALMNSDNEAFFRPALDDIRHLRIGAQVLIQFGMGQGKQGKIYAHQPDCLASWLVRPEGWPADRPGIAYRAVELEGIL